MKILFKNPSLWWKFEGRYYHKDFINGIKNLIKWFPIIWRDRDWDPQYIYTILQHKLELQSDGIGKRDILVSSQRQTEIMRTCARLIQRIKDGVYEGEHMDYHEDRIWFEDILNKPGFSTMESENISERFEEYFQKYPLIYKRVLNGEGIFNIENRENEIERKRVIAMNIAHLNQDRARKLLFKIMEENIEGWWD
jgi:hypothetical protein